MYMNKRGNRNECALYIGHSYLLIEPALRRGWVASGSAIRVRRITLLLTVSSTRR